LPAALDRVLRDPPQLRPGSPVSLRRAQVPLLLPMPRYGIRRTCHPSPPRQQPLHPRRVRTRDERRLRQPPLPLRRLLRQNVALVRPAPPKTALPRQSEPLGGALVRLHLRHACLLSTPPRISGAGPGSSSCCDLPWSARSRPCRRLRPPGPPGRALHDPAPGAPPADPGTSSSPSPCRPLAGSAAHGEPSTRSRGPRSPAGT